MTTIITKQQAKELGLKRYFTGLPCKNGHISEILIKTNYCIDCHKESTKIWRKNNKEHLREVERKRRIKNPKRCDVYKEQWRNRNADKVKESAKLYREKNKKIIAEKRLKTRFENIEKFKENEKKYRKNHASYYLAQCNKRRADKLNATPKWADMQKIKEIYIDAKNKGLTVDHVIPLKGKLVCGLHVETNMQLLTSIENSKKGNKYEI